MDGDRRLSRGLVPATPATFLCPYKFKISRSLTAGANRIPYDTTRVVTDITPSAAHIPPPFYPGWSPRRTPAMPSFYRRCTLGGMGIVSRVVGAFERTGYRGHSVGDNRREHGRCIVRWYARGFHCDHRSKHKES